MDFVAGNGRKEVCRSISTTGNFPALERFEGELRAMRSSHGIFALLAQQ